MNLLIYDLVILDSVLGMELQFEWDQVTAFVRQPDGSLFSWFERFRCFNHLIYGIVCLISPPPMLVPLRAYTIL